MMSPADLKAALGRYEHDHDTVTVNVGGTLIEVFTVTSARDTACLLLDADELAATLEKIGKAQAKSADDTQASEQARA